ncbi:MAG: fibronectin type III domain-containing protein, partial [Betaproteobacteria bacterium]|nr:fibronectin type III domain-containing protein [Betaproteobacteria bacterium]
TTSTPAPNITSPGTKSGQVGVPLSYQITVSSGNAIQAPTSYGASPRPAGIGINTSTGVLSGTPTTATNGTPVVTEISAANSADTDTKNLSFTIAKGEQSLFFTSTQPSPTYSPNGTFSINAADTDPDLAPSPQYASLDTNKCTMVSSTGTTVNIEEAGNCRIKATQPGNSNWEAAPVLSSHTRTIVIQKASQSITFPNQAAKGFVANGTFTITGVTASSGLPVTFVSLDPAVCTTPGTTSTTVTMVDIGVCPIRAKLASNVNYLAADDVDRDIQITETPGAPTLTAAHKGDGRATLEFTGPNNASSVQYYTGTCSAGGQITRTATTKVITTPIVVTNLTNGVIYGCRVTATNSTGTGPDSNSLLVVPDLPPPNVVPELRAAFSIGFSIGQDSTYTVVSTGSPTPTLMRTGAALPGGITFATGGRIVAGTGVLSGIAAPGTAGLYVVSFNASNIAGDDNESVLLNINKGNPVITFNALADRGYSPTPFAISATIATPNSTLSASNIVFTSATPMICSVAGTNVTMLAVGMCTINANSSTAAGYTASYNAAPQVTRGFDIDPGVQTITFGAQTSPRTFVPGATFPISPLASSTAPLAVTYASQSPAVCTVSGTTVTMVGGGLCKIEASQDGNALYAPATDVVQNVTINPASQSIVFGAQPARPFAEGGTFAINPVATASSGLEVAYTSLTTNVCLLQPGPGVTPDVLIVSTGTCTIQATQAGNASYSAATPVNRDIAINAVPPGAPILDLAIPSDGKAMLSVTAPLTNSGAPVTGYLA